MKQPIRHGIRACAYCGKTIPPKMTRALCCSSRCSALRRNTERYATDPAFRKTRAEGKRKWAAKHRQRIGGKGSRHRSAMEDRIGADIEQRGAKYEPLRFSYAVKVRGYCPDFILENGIVIEVKGWFTSADRTKMLAVKAQHPDLDLRLVLATPRQRLRPSSKTTQAMWCEQHGFPWAERDVPEEWMQEKPKGKSLHALSAGIPVRRKSDTNKEAA